jgi:hypothetical protein
MDLQRRSFAEGLGHRVPSGRSTGEQGGEREEWGTGARQPNSFDFEPTAILD